MECARQGVAGVAEPRWDGGWQIYSREWQNKVRVAPGGLYIVLSRNLVLHLASSVHTVRGPSSPKMSINEVLRLLQSV